jgi:hypothetical protein
VNILYARDCYVPDLLHLHSIHKMPKSKDPKQKFSVFPQLLSNQALVSSFHAEISKFLSRLCRDRLSIPVLVDAIEQSSEEGADDKELPALRSSQRPKSAQCFTRLQPKKDEARA